MDGYSRSAGWSPKRGRLDFKIARFMDELYGQEGALEAGLHIACDLKLITKRDVELWRSVVRSPKDKAAKRSREQ